MMGPVEKHPYNKGGGIFPDDCNKGKDLVALGVVVKMFTGSQAKGIVRAVVPGVASDGYPAFIDFVTDDIDIVCPALLVLARVRWCPCCVWHPTHGSSGSQVRPDRPRILSGTCWNLLLYPQVINRSDNKPVHFKFDLSVKGTVYGDTALPPEIPCHVFVTQMTLAYQTKLQVLLMYVQYYMYRMYHHAPDDITGGSGPTGKPAGHPVVPRPFCVPSPGIPCCSDQAPRRIYGVCKGFSGTHQLVAGDHQPPHDRFDGGSQMLLCMGSLLAGMEGAPHDALPPGVWF